VRSPPERTLIRRRTEVGALAKEIVASGGLIPDEVMLRVVTSKLDALRGKVRHAVE
jgi:nucleoside-triphosphate--adenylate kinase